jgi:hypothetical protein
VTGRLLRGLVVAGLVGPAVAACSDVVAKAPVMSPAPEVSVSLPFPRVSVSVSVPPATHRWKPDDLTCPVLNSPAAKRNGLSGPGTRVRGTNSKGGNVLSCRWGPEDETAVSATVDIDTAKGQEAADAGWKIEAGLYKTLLPGVGEQAFISPDIGDNRVAVLVRSGNAMLVIDLIAAKNTATAPLRTDAAAIAAEMLGSLVPA